MTAARTSAALLAILAVAGCGHRSAAPREPAPSPTLPSLVERAAPPPTADAAHDADVTGRVRGAFARDPQLAALSDRVTVVTIAGSVTLRGAVDDVDHARRLTEAARSVDGVAQVDDRLTVGHDSAPR